MLKKKKIKERRACEFARAAVTKNHHWEASCTQRDYPTELPGGSVVKDPSAPAGDTGLIPGGGRSPGGGNGNPLQYACLENPMHRGARRPWVVKEPDTTELLNNRIVSQLWRPGV